MIAVYKDVRLSEAGAVRDLNLTATKPIPPFDTRAEQLAAYDTDARFVASALIASLPVGTVTALTRLLLEHTARGLTTSGRAG